MLEDTVISSINEVMTVPVPRGRRSPMQQRPQYGLSFCLGEGRIIYHHEGKEYLSDKDHAVWLPMGASYLLECRESGHFPLINFSCTVPAFTDFRSIPLRHADSFLRRYETLKELYLFHHRYAGAMSVLYDLLSSLAPLEEGSGEQSILWPAMRYLETHYADQELTNSILAAQIPISEVYFRRLFRAVYQTTPRQYILGLRIQRARELLAGDVMSVGRVAELCGFSGVYHFCRAFRAATGQTPTDYRRSSGGIHI